MSSILVTGANGFVGKALCQKLESSGWQIKRAVRSEPMVNQKQATDQLYVGDIHGDTDWTSALTGCDSIVHLAARVHMMQDAASDPLAEFRKTNTDGTLHLARQAAAQGIRRFVFVSSIKVNGESGKFSAGDAPAPQDAYGLSKWEAELGLHEIGKQMGMEIVVIRPPLVYGPDVGANFLRLMRAIYKGMPLPFGCVHNQRSLIYIGNLVDAITTCLHHPNAAGNTYLVSDRETFSTPELIRQLAQPLAVKAHLPCIPPSWLRFAARLTRKTQAIDRLLESLIVDASAIRQDLEWSPPFSAQQGLAETAEWFRQHIGAT